MIVLPVDAECPEPGAIAEAAAVIRRGGLVAFPTETVYGLGASALDPEAVARIFAAKGRPSYNPLIAHVADVAAARELSDRWPELAERAGAAFWPGPLTLVVSRAATIPDIVTAGLDTVAVRVPAHPVAHALLAAMEIPLAAPSANRFTGVSPTTAEHVARALGDRIDMVLDAGPTTVGIESTVLDLSGSEPVLLRPGSIPLLTLERVVGTVRIGAPVTGEVARPSPGMTGRHYAPRAELHVFPEVRREEMALLLSVVHERGERTGGLLLRAPPGPIDYPIHMPVEPEGYARLLYSAIHRLDEAGCDLIVVDEVPDDAEWAGVRDRLARASWRS